jgi:hypothetical protein
MLLLLLFHARRLEHLQHVSAADAHAVLVLQPSHLFGNHLLLLLLLLLLFHALPIRCVPAQAGALVTCVCSRCPRRAGAAP